MAKGSVDGRVVKRMGNLSYIEKNGEIVPVHNDKALKKDVTYRVLSDDKGWAVKEGSYWYHYSKSGDKKGKWSSPEQLEEAISKKDAEKETPVAAAAEEQPPKKENKQATDRAAGSDAPGKENKENAPSEEPAKKPVKKSILERAGEFLDSAKKNLTQLKQRATSTNFEEHGYSLTKRTVTEYDPKTKKDHEVTYYGLSKGGKEVVPCVFPNEDLTTKYQMPDSDGKIIAASYAVKVGKDGKLSYKISYKTKGRLFADAKYKITNDETEIKQGNGPFESVSFALHTVSVERGISHRISDHARKEAAKIAADTSLSPEDKKQARQAIVDEINEERGRHDRRVTAINETMLDECENFFSIRNQRAKKAAEERKAKQKEAKEKSDLDDFIDSSYYIK